MTHPRRPAASVAPVRAAVAIAALAAAALVATPPQATAGAPDQARDSVAAGNGIVVHGVDAKELAARLRAADQMLTSGDAAQAGTLLATLTTADLSPLVEEREGVYLAASEGVAIRVAGLPPEGLASYRAALDARADAVLTAAARSGSPTGLAREATRLAFTTAGPRLLLLLADLQAATGDLGAAIHALDDLLRLLPDHAPPESLAAAASRLAGIHASRGDAPSVRGVTADLAPAVLAQPSAVMPGKTLAEELAEAAKLAARRDTSPPAPTGPLKIAGDARVSARSEAPPGDLGRNPGTLTERPLPIGTVAAPALLVRLRGTSRSQTSTSRVEAIAPAPGGTFRSLWQWPPATATPRDCRQYAFAPRRLGPDLVVLTWAADSRSMGRFSAFEDAGEERHELVVLSIPGEGRLVEERGVDEESRPDGDPELETLSFCGSPTVDGDRVYAAAIRHAVPGELEAVADAPVTELHLCRFDLLREGRGARLVLRWRRHLLDGLPVPSAQYNAPDTDVVRPRLEAPSAPLVAGGRVFIASNTGAVACVDAASGAPEWVETYPRFGPSSRPTIVATDLVTWDDVPLASDGPSLFAAPRDSESLLQYRRARRRTRSLRVESIPFAGASGTAQHAGQIPENVIPSMVGGVRDGLVVLAGRVPRRGFASSAPDGSPLIAFRLDRRDVLHAQVQEFVPAGAPQIVGRSVLFPTVKAVYSVPLDDFEAAPAVLWRPPPAGPQLRGPDRLGTLVPDGRRLWSVTPTRIVLLEPE